MSVKRVQSPVLESPVACIGSPAHHPNSERVPMPSLDPTTPGPVDVIAPLEITSGKPLKEVPSAVSVYAMDEPSFSGGVISPGSRHRTVGFEEASSQDVYPPTDTSAPGVAHSRGTHPTEGDSDVAITQQTQKGDDALQQGKEAQNIAVHVNASAMTAGVLGTHVLERQYHVEVRSSKQLRQMRVSSQISTKSSTPAISMITTFSIMAVTIKYIALE